MSITKMDRQPSWVAAQHYEQRVQQCVSCYAFGRNDFGQSGISNVDSADAIVDACAIDSLRKTKVACVAGGQGHSAFVTADGELFMCGSNENSRIAMKNVACVAQPQRAAALDTRVIAAVACGSNFTVAVTKKGELIGWGAGEYGQIGPPCVVEQAVPRMIKGLPPSVRIERVAAGAAHVLALSEKFQVFSFGVGLHGALGHGNRENVDTPTLISGLAYAGVTAIDAGDDHSVALAADGRLWTWGQGTFGALGHETNESQHTPQQVAALMHTQIMSMAAGGHHTVALSAKGRVYTWGSNTDGQLGVGNCIDASLPCVVEDSSSLQVSQVSAGRKHTILLTARGSLLGFGCTEHGQLGVLSQDTPFLSVPQPIPIHNQEAEMQPALAVACGDHSLVVCCMQANFPQCMSTMHTCNTRLTIPDLLTLAKAARPLSGLTELKQDPGTEAQALINLGDAIRNVFSSPGLLIAGFSIPAPPRAAYDDTVERSDSHLNLDLAGIKDVYESILHALNPDVVLALQSTIATMLQQIYQQEELAAAQGRASAISQAQWLKVLVILLLNPANSDAHGTARQLIESMARVLYVLKARPRKVLLNWLSQLPPDVLGGRCIRPLQQHLTKYVETYGWGKGRPHVLLVGSVVHILVDANRQAGNPVPHTELHNAAVSKGVMESLQAEWLAWQKIPWIMTPECKKIIMQGEAMLMQNNEVNNSMQRAILMMTQGTILMGPHLSYVGQLRLQIRRNHIVADALQQLTLHMEDLHKPLRVTFLSEDGKSKEEAVDEGGVSKEFFQLLIRELFLPDYGMFEYHEDTREYWFSPAALEIGVSKTDFKMVGIVLGLGIFNAVILDVHFPLVVYKKLLKGVPTLEDLEDANPSLASGLKSLLAYDGDDVAEVFCRTFEVEYMVFDTMQTVELKPGGSQIPVTKHNRKEFVDLLVDWYLNKSVADAFEEFKSGFYSVASGSSLVLFNHHELELLICGLPHLDFAALESAAVYDGGYSAEHPAIRNFWEILHSFTLEQKKSFLTFVTGCNRAPMGGLGKLKLMVQRDGPDSNKLPTSHTCFNVLLLPEYESKAKMQDRLKVAIMNAEGFGLQ